MANPMLAKMMELLAHHYNMSGAMSREAAAKGLGLNPEPYKHPYPGSTNVTFQVVTPGEATATAKAESGPPPPTPATGAEPSALPPNSPQRGPLTGLLPLLLSSLATAGLLGGIGAVLWPKDAAPANPPIINVPEQNGLDAQVEVEWGQGKGENGQFGVRYRLGPNGQWVSIPMTPPK